MKLKSTLFISVMLLFANIGFAQQITITTNHNDANFNVGETISFQVYSKINTTVNYLISRGEYAETLQQGQLTLYAYQTQTVSYVSSEPGIVHIKLSGNASAVGAAIVGADDIKLFGSEPSDFDAFWNGVKGELNNVPMNPVVQPHSSTAYSDSYTVQLGNIDNRKVYGMLHVPKGSGPFPAVVEFPAYGQGTIEGLKEIAERTNCIILAISIHNAPVTEQDPNAYQPSDPTDRNLFYYKHSITAGIRAIDYLVSRPDFNGSEIAVTGESQGAGLSMLVAGLDNRVDVMAVANSALCNHSGLNYGHPSGFPLYVKQALLSGNQQELQAILQAVPYYDATIAAKRFHGKSLLLGSYDDVVTDAETQFAASNNLDGKKIIIHNLSGGHNDRPQFRENRFRILRRYLEGAQNPPFPWAETHKGYGVDAGADKNGQVNQSVLLTGKIERGQEVNPNIEVKWKKISGPGNVNFSNANNYSTSASFSQQGTYILEFGGKETDHLSDGGYFVTMSDRIKITIGGGSSQQIDLALALDANNTTVSINNPVTFILTLSNNASYAAHNVQAKFQLPNGLNFLSANGQGQYDAGSGIWNVGFLNNWSNKTLVVTATMVSQTPVVAFAQVTLAAEQDVDSQPNNNNGPIPYQDDEAAVTISLSNNSTGTCDEINGFLKIGELDNHAYYKSNEIMNWSSAKVSANNQGAYLTSISSQAENDFIQSSIGNDIVFIGFNDESTEEQGSWANGESVSLNLSEGNTAERDYAVINFWNGHWEMQNAIIAKRFVMEKNCEDVNTDFCTAIDGFTKFGDFNNHGYYRSHQSFNWNAAKQDAQNNGGHLATISTQAENEFVKNNMGNEQLFIGFNDANAEGNGQWVNSEPVSLNLSYGNSNDRDYGLINFWAGTWEMQNGMVEKRYILEKVCDGNNGYAVSPSTIEMNSIFPNPANDYVTISFDSFEDENIQFRILGVNGKEQSNMESFLIKGSNEVLFDISDLPAGAFMLIAKGAKRSLYWRFVKL